MEVPVVVVVVVVVVGEEVRVGRRGSLSAEWFLSVVAASPEFVMVAAF